ncbi:MAG: glycosyltransferase [Actinomycetota bacterium]|nr:glycosyltransferase [Actinomycetota bacterium]
MSPRVLLSVVVPFYNVELYIGDCLESIARQSLRDLEVILVDDGSEDGSREVAQKYADADSRFRILTQENQGLGPARNTGAASARGSYLTFIDSDDVVPRDAFELMTSRLENTDSDFAAGNARRFNLHGTRASWLHRGPFAHDLSHAQVTRFPSLAYDRMIWNKVFRRSFWDEGGYEFPATMYEDYPVTLRAHLDAESVEVVSAPVYHWRERDAGETSITQQLVSPRNTFDRVASALQVLELADTAPADVRRVVHDALARTDVVAVARGVAHPGNETETEALAEAAQGFFDALDPEIVATRPALEQLMQNLVRARLAGQLAAVLDVRDREAPIALSTTQGILRRRRLISIPGVDLTELPAPLRVLSAGQLDLEAKMLAATWEGSVQLLDVEVWVNFLEPARPRLTAWLQRADGHRIFVAVRPEVRVLGNVVRATLAVDASAVLGASSPGEDAWVLRLRLETRGATREGICWAVAPGSATLPLPWYDPGDEWSWVQSGQQLHVDEWVVRTLRRPVQIDSAEPGYGAEIRVAGRSREPLSSGATLLRARSGGSARREVLFPVLDTGPANDRAGHGWTSHVQLEAVADPRHYDELATSTTEWTLSLVTPQREQVVGIRPGLQVGRFWHAHREVRLLGNRFHVARLDETNPELMIEDISLSGSLIRFSGRGPVRRMAAEHLLLTWYADAEDPTTLEVPLTWHAESFDAEMDLAELARISSPMESEWLVSIPQGDRPMPAYLSNSLVRRLPGPVAVDGAAVRVSTHRRFAARFLVERSS